MIGRRGKRSPGRTSFAGVVSRLAGASYANILFALITSPIIARTLGPAGQGQVTAIFAVLSIAPWVSELGLTAFLGREQARRSRSPSTLLGSTVPIAMVTALCGVALAVPLAHLLGRGRPQVVEFIELGMFLLPISATIQLLSGLAGGSQRWGLVIAPKLISASIGSLGIVVLAVEHRLTVTTLAVTYLLAGLVANLPLLVLTRGTWPWHFSRRVARAGLSFGTRSWLSTIAASGNAYLDQVIMAGLVSSRQLGLYALAVSLATGTGSLVAAAASAMFPRVAMGEVDLAARACRVSVLLTLLPGACLVACSPWVVPLVWGGRFTDAVPMLAVLQVASVFYVPAQVLGAGLAAAGRPTAPAVAQAAGLAVTVPGLIILLPVAGGLGAAYVSLAAYAVTFAVTVTVAARTFRMRYVEMLVATPTDVRWLYGRILRRQPQR